MNVNNAKTFLFSILVSFVILTGLFLYSHFIAQMDPFLAFNSAVANTALMLFGIILLIGPLSRIYNVFDWLLKYRKDIGLTTFVYVLFHVLLILFMYPYYKALELTYTNGRFVIGLIAFFITCILFLFSFNRFITLIPRKTWWLGQNWGIRFAALLAFIHMTMHDMPLWYNWITERSTILVPPVSLFVGIFSLFVAVVRFSENAGPKIARYFILLTFIVLILCIGSIVMNF